MKKKCTWLLMVVLLATMLFPELAYATQEETESETVGETVPETLPVKPAEDPKEALAEAMGKSILGADEAIADGVYIGETEISGMTAEQAMDAVLAYVEELGKKTLTLTLEGADDVEPLKVSVAELGLRTEGLAESVMEALAIGKSGNLIARYKAEKDLLASNQKYDLNLSVDENMVKNFVTVQTSALSVEPIEAELTRVSGGFDVSQSKTGLEVNVAATADAVLKVLTSWDRQDVTMAAVAQVKQPKRTTEMLSKVQDEIGSFSTSSSASGDRLQNLKIGVKYSDGILIMPGESWSMHDALAPFSAENGYTKQVAYQNGGYVQEYGGGICQLATTLYNAALRAEVHVSKRFNHSMTVGYTYPGLDATINDGGSKDLELTNDFDFPIYIEASVGGGSVTYTVWGMETRPSNRTIKFYGEYTSYEDSGVQVTDDPSLPLGIIEVDQATSYPAATAVAYKEIYVNGVLEERIKLHTDKYRPSPRKERHGTGAPAPTEPAPTDPAAPTDPTVPAEPAPTEPTQPSTEAPAA